MKMGLIVNPIAGMGGKVGLKGTDNVLEEAIAKGAEPLAPKRAVEFLQKLKEDMPERLIRILVPPEIMGEQEAKAAGFPIHALRMKLAKETTAEDTKTAVRLLTAKKVDLIVFVGGDGTAKDILDALQSCHETPVLGVPSGVKMYSGIFAVNISAAAEVVLSFAQKQAETAEFEIMDTDENAIRRDEFAVKLHGYLKAPFLPAHIQGSKQVTPDTADEQDNQTAIARFVVEELPKEVMLVLGPGTTVENVAELLGIEKTVLGVDVYKNGKVLLDVDEAKILREVQDWKNTRIILSPIGHQGILLGRGNQQISPKIIKLVGKEQIVVTATKNKLRNIEGNVLRVDTGDREVDKMLKGYIKVVTDYREWRLMRVE